MLQFRQSKFAKHWTICSWFIYFYKKILLVYSCTFRAAIGIKCADAILNISDLGGVGQVQSAQFPHASGKVSLSVCWDSLQGTMPFVLLEPKDTFVRHIWPTHKYFWIILFYLEKQAITSPSLSFHLTSVMLVGIWAVQERFQKYSAPSGVGFSLYA